uniref:Uncharacterized protein n=1 Tax=Pyrodinium bahamense TaxID=73915 RepID=A0A7S0AGG9_9DINO|mmetsp:Transcript_34086/g.94286  ORF Transcript_34086/g.94286 Transcript_34086/m.94286 type:complete len:115 (+) Transcript_34086:112-456(+)
MSEQDALLHLMQNEVETMEEQAELLQRLAVTMTEMLKSAHLRGHELEALNRYLVNLHDSMLNQGVSTKVLLGRHGRTGQAAFPASPRVPSGCESNAGALLSSTTTMPKRWENCD